jgi:hypothetical protein
MAQAHYGSAAGLVGNVSRHPGPANAYDSLAEIEIAAGDPVNAEHTIDGKAARFGRQPLCGAAAAPQR